ncbi:nucleotide sugar dehydrogenase [Halovenus sp. WSH3]|uniref:UDP-N-acetyl-D-mannosamine dehydrogenase n=1 Tax=Halovenus carboxidivorans TaxID=2692199 RepID=A0A6B0TC54_9EURY|nr:nucleotide sugar dehydrogenase [Halovenus carboxidivorans]MXR52982.1 nucleotide sugar dehydrogenase [Halovenus carboxidivorans]
MSSVCIHGLGYIGLPTAAMLANYGHDVYGYDADETVRGDLQNGDVHLDEPGLRAFVTQALESAQLEITDEIVQAKYHIICVPTPFDQTERTADLSYLRDAAHGLAPLLRAGDTVILESTVPPGTTVEQLQPILESTGLTAGTDFALVHCPETVLPGNIISELRENDRTLGGVNGVSTESAVRLYDSFVSGEIRTTDDPTTAEFVKLIQNTYRDVNIALANEIARLADDYGIDSREAIDLANAHPRVDILQPGPGVGGHCLPIDPWFLGTGSDQIELISTAREVNDGMTEFVIELLERELNSLDGTKIAILGVAYKGNVSDARNSPGLELARTLADRETAELATDGGPTGDIEVEIHDPHVTDPTLDLADLDSSTAGADALVVTTDHDEYADLDPEPIAERMHEALLIDTKAHLDAPRWREAGFAVRQI